MERKYQVFVSSTYEDLKTERQAAISCLLDMNCIPVGMEQFPASSLSQWEYYFMSMNLARKEILGMNLKCCEHIVQKTRQKRH